MLMCAFLQQDILHYHPIVPADFALLRLFYLMVNPLFQ
ncbi:hypothetical protein ETAE_2942 [Edwardsiella piscicida]|uniref:Uncharacterized protein n=2 Tax=Edwardsiella TaxID=635 RepID=A0A0H3DXT2_EDWTF|nr:hypothetical protein ETAE_2942 [Edwardsiella tarda EIB202]ADM42775.1 hypothetical protein ETAF_2672 [Edwardsiella tarda FL6-60]